MFPNFSYASTAQLYQKLISLIRSGTINIPANLQTQQQSYYRSHGKSQIHFAPPKKKIKYSNISSVAPVRRINDDPKISRTMFLAKLKEAKLNNPDFKQDKAQNALEKYKQITELLGACFDSSNYPKEETEEPEFNEDELNKDIAKIKEDIKLIQKETETINQVKKQ
eukprot:UN26390